MSLPDFFHHQPYYKFIWGRGMLQTTTWPRKGHSHDDSSLILESKEPIPVEVIRLRCASYKPGFARNQVATKPWVRSLRWDKMFTDSKAVLGSLRELLIIYCLCIYYGIYYISLYIYIYIYHIYMYIHGFGWISWGISLDSIQGIKTVYLCMLT